MMQGLFLALMQGRNPDELSSMVGAIRKHNLHTDKQPITISIELEKKREELIALEALPDLVFISKEYACFRGYQSAEEACLQIRTACRKE